MTDNHDANRRPLCPSTQPSMAGAVVFGVVGGLQNEGRRLEDPRVGYLTEPPTRNTGDSGVVRIRQADRDLPRGSAVCGGGGCLHFDGRDCRLASRVVEMLPTVVDVLPACRLRPDCRWWQQESKAASLRCPMIVTEVYAPSEALKDVADPQQRAATVASAPRRPNEQS
jgi:hypothetical protein